MHTLLRTLFLSVCLIVPTYAVAQERVDHYQGKQAENVDQATANLREANAELAELLSGEVGEYDIHDIHSLSYTLEESLARLINETEDPERVEQLEHLLAEVEDMHFQSEGLDREGVIDHGTMYLNGISKLID